MENIIKEAKGVNGQLELLENRVRIKRKGFMAVSIHGFKGDKEILIKSITAIQFKPAGTLTNGYIQFSFSGSSDAKGGIMEAAKDENSVVFKKNQQSTFETVKALIEAKMSEQATSPTGTGSLDELEKLADLKSKGIITEDEFNAKKKQILGI